MGWSRWTPPGAKDKKHAFPLASPMKNSRSEVQRSQTQWCLANPELWSPMTPTMIERTCREDQHQYLPAIPLSHSQSLTMMTHDMYMAFAVVPLGGHHEHGVFQCYFHPAKCCMQHQILSIRLKSPGFHYRTTNIIPLLLKSKPPKPSSRLKTIWSIIIDSNKSPHCFHGATLRRKELDGTQVHCHWAQILPWTQKWRWDQIMNSMQHLLKHVETGTRPSDQLNVGQMYKTWTLVFFLPIGSGTAPDDKHWLIRAYRLTLDR